MPNAGLIGVALGRRRRQGAGTGIFVTINGLTGGMAETDDFAALTMSVSSGTISARKWGSTPGGSEYGTGTNPTDYSADVGGTLYATATVDGEDYSRSAPITYPATDMVMTIETTGASEAFVLEWFNTGTYSGTVDMGDGNGEQAFSAYNDAVFSTTYPSAGLHTIRLRGSAPAPFFSNNETHRVKIRTIHLGDIGLTRLQDSFKNLTGLTSFTAGITDTSAVTSFYRAWSGCTALTVCDVTGMDFAANQNFEATWANCAALLTIPGLSDADTGNLLRADEMLLGAGLPSDFDPRNWDITALQTAVGMFDMLDPAHALPQAVYDAVITNFAAQAASPGIQAGIHFGFGVSPFTTGGQVETDRQTFIAQVASLTDGGNDVPETMAAPALATPSANEIEVTLATAPFSNGRPILSYDLRHRIGAGPWTTVTDISDPHTIPGLTPETTYEVQTRAENFDGNGDWSPGASIATPASSFAVEEIGEEPVITVQSGNISVTIASGPYAGTYTEDVNSTTLTVTGVEAAPKCLVKPTLSAAGGTDEDDDITIVPGLWLYDGADPGDQTWQHERDGTPIAGATSLTYTIVAADAGTDFTTVETFDGETVESDALAISAGDVTAPVLSLPTAAANGETGATSLGVTTDEGNGSLYWGIYPTASTPSAADVVAGTGATVSGSQAVSATGVQSVSNQTGLTADTAYRVHYVQDDAAANRSNVATAAEFTTAGSSAMQDDTDGIFWFESGGVVTSASNVTGWTNSKSNSDYNLTTIPTNGGNPTWNSTNQCVEFDGINDCIRSGVDLAHLMDSEVTANSETLVIFAVVDLKSGEGRGPIFNMSANEGQNESLSLGYASAGGGASDSDFGFYLLARGSSEAVGSDFSVFPTTNTTPIGKVLLEYHLSSTGLDCYVDGILENSQSVTIANRPTTSAARITLGARGGPENLSRVTGYDLYEMFATIATGSSLTDIRNELQSKHGL